MAIKYNDSSYVISKKFLTEESILNNYYIYKKLYQEINKPDIALKYADSILSIEEDFKTLEFDSGLKIVDENILFNKTKLKTENKIKDYKSSIIAIIMIALIMLIFYVIRRKKQKEKLVKLNAELLINKGKYNKSLKENIEFKKNIKLLLKEKKFDEISKLHKTHEIEDLGNDTYIEYLASEIEPTFLNRLEKHTLIFTDIEKLVLYYRKNNHTYQEIAIITNRTLRSIQSLSYRLNKKILAKKNQDLANFLENL
ncbi:hypothetical protein [Polaribacter sp. R77954]|uniref:hypothetical protein n=1 Tax=Polaribacter sp. R77954 TaxID=3093870 RepID=UPI0037CB449B